MTNTQTGQSAIDYQHDSMSPETWKRIIDATRQFEKRWNSGNRLQPHQFAAEYADIPIDLLIHELESLRQELDSTPSNEPANDPDQTSIVRGHQADRFRDLELLRKGGMGEIYRAWDQECQRYVAIKKIRKEYAGEPEARRRFLTEAEITAGLEHPGILPIYSTGIDAEGREYYAMRWIRGPEAKTLRESIDEFHRSVKLDQTFARSSGAREAFMSLIRRLAVVADTIAYAHHHGVVHRDLKPMNILIGTFGETIIADWGLARKIDSQSHQGDDNLRANGIQKGVPTERGEVTTGIGTPGFSAPELEYGGQIDSLKSADIYSLGAVLRCICTGESPKSDDNLLEPNEAPEHLPVRCRDDLRPLQNKLNMQSLLAIADKAMSSRPTDRYSSAKEFHDELQSWLAGDAVSARKESLWERATRWPNRNRTPAAAIGGALVIAIVGGVLIMIAQAHRQRLMDAEAQRLRASLHGGSQVLGKWQDSQEKAMLKVLKLRAEVLHQQARKFQAKKDFDSAEKVFVELLAKETLSLKNNPTSGDLLEAYRRTATELQALYTRTNKPANAFDVANRWNEFARARLLAGQASPQDRIFAIAAMSSLGQLYGQTGSLVEANSQFQQAVDACVSDDTLRRSPEGLYQQIELKTNQMLIKLRGERVEEAMAHWKSAVDAAIILRELEDRSLNAWEKVQAMMLAGLSALRIAGLNDQASEQEKMLMELKLVPAKKSKLPPLARNVNLSL